MKCPKCGCGAFYYGMREGQCAMPHCSLFSSSWRDLCLVDGEESLRKTIAASIFNEIYQSRLNECLEAPEETRAVYLEILRDVADFRARRQVLFISYKED